MRKIKANGISCLLMGFLILFITHTGYSKEKILTTDYSIADHWLSLPAPVKAVDVFYLYPTSWQKARKSDPHICEIDNVSMLKGSRQSFATQATAFELIGNIYAPYYRQFDNDYSLTASEGLKPYQGIPAHDVIAAFDYYIKHFNKGRPFILASHSQGSIVSLSLLPHIVKNPEVYNRMIAAYVIGYPVSKEFMADNPKLKFAEGADDTGVIISFNTQSPNVLPGRYIPGLNNKTGLVINPITWTRDESTATTAQGLGSFMPDNTATHYSKVPQYADAKIDITNGVLICSTADEDYIQRIAPVMPNGVYHCFEYSFYYFNIRQNAENRTNKFLGK